MKELCRMYAKKDSNERESWRAVAQDVCDSVGIGEERSPHGGGGVVRRWSGGGGGGETGEGREKGKVYDLKAHIDKLTDILEEVKLQNNMKDEEIKALRDRMIKMESIIPVQDDDVNGEGGGSPQRDGGDGGDGGGGGDGMDQPEVRVQRLMDEDPAFRRGRLRWLKQEQRRILNLQQQNVTKKLRGQNQNQGQNTPTVPVHLPGTGRFIPPQECKLKFPFKSNPAHRLSWGPASAALQALGLGEGGGEGGEQREEGGGGGGVEGKGSPSPPPPQGQCPSLLPLPFQAPPPRMRTPSPHRSWQQRNQGNQGNQGAFHYHHQGNNQNHQRRDRQQLPGQLHPWQRLPRPGPPPLPADMLVGVGPPPGGWGFTTPPRMRRLFSAPDLKNNKETPI
ncbi:kinesin-like protein KIF1C [Lates japonicus]|uniref:Kinesin-like protein KIF1C n=1 Tax=Lates japonicus TaxID=270547 RepID=A0AAD3NG53_LATJO|nr:kinesin-like protein KIF1C [Lates japonicus]